MRLAGIALLALLVVAASSANAAAGYACQPTPTDAFGPFGTGEPPLRARIGTGHVLTGVVLSAADCKPIARARVQLMQAGRNGRYTRAGSGTVIADRFGRFRFEGPRPGSDFGEPHIHIRVVAPLFETLVTRYVLAPGERRGKVRLVLVPAAL